MPNWCNNELRITSKDPEKIQKLVDAWASGRFMQTLYPCPQDLRDTMAGSYSDDEKQRELKIKEEANIEKHGYANWYDWCVAKWGTKWDVGADDGEAYVSGNTFYANFNTAWSPPIEFFIYLDGRNRDVEDQNDDYDIECDYEEEGMGFIGTYSTKYGEDTRSRESE